MIVENPFTQPHYLTLYFPIKPTLIDKDRTKNGDHMKKPTQYWFLNCKPEENICFESLDFVQRKTVEAERGVGKENQRLRSMIHPQYARRFIIQHILDCKGGVY